MTKVAGKRHESVFTISIKQQKKNKNIRRTYIRTNAGMLNNIHICLLYYALRLKHNIRNGYCLKRKRGRYCCNNDVCRARSRQTSRRVLRPVALGAVHCKDL